MRLILFICVLVLQNVYVIFGNNQDMALSEEYSQFLEEVRVTFEENLHRAFRNEAVRDQQGRKITKSYVHKLHNILLSVGDSKIELTDLTLPWLPDFRIININADLSKLCLDVGFKLGTLSVEGQYETNNLALQKLLPISSNGKIVIKFNDVITNGRIGLLIQGDSFVPENYDIEFKSSQNDINVQYYVSSGSQVENQISDSNNGVDDTLVNAVWKQLRGILTSLLDRQLREAVVQFSVCETLADEDEELRQVAQIRSARANGILDSLLCSAKDYIVAKNYQAMETPPFDVVFKGKLTGIEQGTLETGPGYILDLSTLSRQQDLSIYEEEHKFVVYGFLNLREFKHGYETYTSKYESSEVEGGIKATVYKNKIFVKLSVEKNEEQSSKTTLDKIEVISIDDIDVDVSGLGSLSWLNERIRGWVIGNLRYSALGVLEKTVEEAFNNAIRETSEKKSPPPEPRSFWNPMIFNL